MEIIIKDRYRIVCNKYSWDLHVRSRLKKDSFVIKGERKGQIARRKGDWSTWKEDSFFTKLPHAIDNIIRYEAMDIDLTMDLEEFKKQMERVRDEILDGIAIVMVEEGGKK